MCCAIHRNILLQPTPKAPQPAAALLIVVTGPPSREWVSFPNQKILLVLLFPFPLLNGQLQSGTWLMLQETTGLHIDSHFLMAVLAPQGVGMTVVDTLCVCWLCTRIVPLQWKIHTCNYTAACMQVHILYQITHPTYSAYVSTPKYSIIHNLTHRNVQYIHMFTFVCVSFLQDKQTMFSSDPKRMMSWTRQLHMRNRWGMAEK